MISKYIKRAWKAYTKNWTSFITAYILLFAIGLGIMGVGMVSFLMSSLAKGSITEIFSNLLPILASVGVGIIFFVLALVVMIALSTGIAGMAAESLKKKTKVKTMWKIAKKRWQTAIGVSVVVFIVAIVLLAVIFSLSAFMGGVTGFVLGAIIYYLVMILFTLTTSIVAVEKFGAIKCVERSVKIAKKNYLKVLTLTAVYVIINLLVSLIPFVGSLFSSFVIAPMMQISLVDFYLKNK